jgi:bacillithiol system protein YtxJ
MIQQIHSKSELEEALRRTAVFYKHSSRCWMSARAVRQLERYARAAGAQPVFLIDVIAQRDLSNWLTEISGVRHASPQVILMEDGQARFHASHLGVTAKALLAAMGG